MRKRGRHSRPSSSDEFTIFGLTTSGSLLHPAHSALHKLIWKFIWQNITSETFGNGKPKPHTILRSALKRLEKKIVAHLEEIEIKKKKLDGLNQNLKLGKRAKSKLAPWIELDEFGEIEHRSATYLELADEFNLHARSIEKAATHPSGWVKA